MLREMLGQTILGPLLPMPVWAFAMSNAICVQSFRREEAARLLVVATTTTTTTTAASGG